MNDVDLKAENAALRKQNKNLKNLLEEALEIIAKLKDIVDQSPAEAKPARKTVKKKKAHSVKRPAARKSA
jgi:hypothetical protein